LERDIDEAKLIADTRHLAPLLDEATQLRAILGKSVATARGKLATAETTQPPACRLTFGLAHLALHL